jgi:hypothetical protein
MQQTTQQPNRFKAEMPRIPGVDDASGSSLTRQKTGLLLLVLVLTAIVCGTVAWRTMHSTRTGSNAAALPEASRAQTGSADFLLPTTPRFNGSTVVATLDQLSKPWSAKEFSFFDPVARQDIPAMVIRLPGTSANSSAAYWAFSLNAPYQLCQLEYVTDLSQLAARFGYNASHPMVAAGCSGTVYDPLQLGTIPTGAWVRGEIVQGAGIRPPISIDVQIRGRDLVADRIE